MVQISLQNFGGKVVFSGGFPLGTSGSVLKAFIMQEDIVVYIY